MFVVTRNPSNPLISPRRDHPWEALATFNPSVVKNDKGFCLFYRAMAMPDALVSPYVGQSAIGYAFSEDGTNFHSRRQVIVPSEPFDAYGCEDPRATFFEGKWYIFYTALGGVPYGPSNIKVGVAIGDTPDKLREKHLVTPFNAKAATLLPERIDGDAVLLLTAHTDWTAEHPRPTIGIARAKNIEDFWSEAYWKQWHDTLPEHALAELRRSDNDHIEVGATPILTEAGWLLIYSYIQNYYDERSRVFSIEAALLDRKDPRKLINRTYPFMVAEEIYERYGIVPNIVFPSGALMNGEYLDIYYGAADTTCAKASIKLIGLMCALDPSEPARAFTRAKENPILTPTTNAFETASVFNPAAIDLGDSVHILYRAMSADHTSTIGYARAKDGVHIDERLPVPVYGPRAEFEMKHREGNSGCEDPRVVMIDDRLYMTYTAYDGVRTPKGAVSSISVSDFLERRFDRWTMPALITPLEVDDKDIALLPERIDGNYILYHRVSNRICADILTDLSFEHPVARCIEVMGPREGMWDAWKVGIAGPPIKVPQGWLFFYHGVSHRKRYRVGAALLDHAGTALISRTADPVFEPVEPWEKEGDVPEVVFPCGFVVRGDVVYMYYGGADKVVGVATASLSRIIAALT